MAIKKSFQPLITFLEANQGKSVKTIMEEVVAMCSTKGRAAGDGVGAVSTFIKSASGETVAVLDYYFKRWMPLVGDGAVKFGKKASAASGYSSMSTEGTSHWTKQQRTAKNAIEGILVSVESGELAASGIAAEKEKIEAARKEVVATDAGFEAREDVVAYLEAMGVDLSTPAETEAES